MTPDVVPAQEAVSVAPPSPSTMFSGDYETFREAAAHCEGYDSEAAAKAAQVQLRQMMEASPPTEIDGRFQQVHSALCVVRDHLKAGRLSVLDIGGGAGNYFFRIQSLLAAEALDWSIVETSSLVAACSGLGAPFRYFDSIPARGSFDVALISGTLQYLAEPFEALRAAAKVSGWILLTRVPIRHGPTQFMVQTVPEHIYRGSMPIQVFCSDELSKALESIGSIELTWSVSLDDPAFPGMGVSNRGYLVRCRHVER
ncbi:methyltransferase, TIGR04325 family [Bradyrhizobium sp. CCBAU 51745]|uniref:methyltransferase, TIGR04325 family n=1 Tax=Bradyrhizobium sp. CCBAU 51745 TaxID=1325099 RepID=UPI0023061830|nr:methyltransferase, TIGR04325 family [Bradyrhizobium sp. CCBAU 51745]